MQSDTQMRFSDIENSSISNENKNKVSSLPGTSKPQDFGANPGYQTNSLPKQQSINSVESAQTVITEQPEKKSLCFLINPQKNNMTLR